MLNESLVSEMLKGVQQSYNQMYSLNAIWLDFSKPIYVVRNGKKEPTKRIALTDNIKVIDGVIVDAKNDNDATHEIVRMKGTARQSDNEFKIEGRNLLTGKLEGILLP